jgi:hypothetical protein
VSNRLLKRVEGLHNGKRVHKNNHSTSSAPIAAATTGSKATSNTGVVMSIITAPNQNAADTAAQFLLLVQSTTATSVGGYIAIHDG